MFRTASTLGLLTLTLAASPAPRAQDVMNFRFNAHEAGCMTRGVQALQKDQSVKVLPDPNHPGKGMILSINRSSFQALIRELAATNRTCIEQLVYLLTPNDQLTPSGQQALQNSKNTWFLPQINLPKY